MGCVNGSERIIASYRRTKDRAPEGARLEECGNAVVFYVGHKAVANFHKNKPVATFTWLAPKGAEDHEQLDLLVLPASAFLVHSSDILNSLWLSLFKMDISTLTENPPEPQVG